MFYSLIYCLVCTQVAAMWYAALSDYCGVVIHITGALSTVVSSAIYFPYRPTLFSPCLLSSQQDANWNRFSHS